MFNGQRAKNRNFKSLVEFVRVTSLSHSDWLPTGYLYIHVTYCLLKKISEITNDQEDQYACKLTLHNKEKLTFES